ncbi:MAG: alpha/beta fold hydrolase [Luteolibacter sp.]
MPVLSLSSFKSSRWLPGGHFQTIAPALLRRVPVITTERERLELEDGDFLDLDWSGSGKSQERLAIISHGLEGSSRAAYVQGMAAALVKAGWDVLAWNLRGCSGEPNRLQRFYHSGATEDLAAVVSHASARHPAQQIDLVGFSLGGNLTLKYLGEQPSGKISRAVVFSVPCDLADAADQLARRTNRIYMSRFMRDMQTKLRIKAGQFPEAVDWDDLRDLRTFLDFDDRVTAPFHGFLDAEDYWEKCSSRVFLGNIGVPTLLVNALNDPFLGAGCFPRKEAEENKWLTLETPEQGGHVGFFSESGDFWSERRAVEFLGG